jgi:predicted 2-oxoglutarate/Fe(II)-dependent dioxygenase YbiX
MIFDFKLFKKYCNIIYMYEVKPGTDIYVIDNVISDDFCQTIKTIIDHTPGKQNDTYSDMSNVICKSLNPHDNIKNLEFAKVIDNEIFKIVGKIIEKITDKIPTLGACCNDSGYNLRKIHGATRNHIDDIFDGWQPSYRQSELRKMTLIIAINGDYDGGEFYFSRQDVKVKLKQGQAIVFPPYWTHPHQTGELLNNTYRYTINTWLNY